MNQEDIKKILPHRNSMLLLDEVEKIDDVSHGKYHVRGDEWFLDGHFPGNPIVPGVVQCEMLAQSICILLEDKMTDEVTPMYTGLNNVKFRNPVRPGDTFEMESTVTRAKHPFYFAHGKGMVDGKLCIEADFSFAVVPKQKD